MENIAQRPPAVRFCDVWKSYGTGQNKQFALQNIDLAVPRGSIYGLLGPSGCGKTTLLRCAVGRLQVDHGLVVSLGKKPGARGHGIPGNLVGYMPQEIALYNEFTISETLHYFGRLCGMPSTKVKQRIEFLINFLKLPESSRKVQDMSGGQRRRVSFAIALLQEPKLIILDEPTVGVDPLLRQRIWNHLIDISQTGDVTIIITTHYIEEARQADMVGLMRNGRLLAEAPPEQLLDRHRLETLEGVFLKLCQDDQVADDFAGQESVGHSSLADSEKDDLTEDPPLLKAQHLQAPTNSNSSFEVSLSVNDSCYERFRMFTSAPKFGNIIALFIKNLLILKRRIGFLMFQFLLPSLQIVLFCLCIGRMPADLNMAVVNNETSGTLGEKFLSKIDPVYIAQNNFSHDMNAAIQSVKDGTNWGVIGIGENFTQDLIARFIPGSQPDNKTLDSGTVHLYLDMTNQEILMAIQQKLMDAFQAFADEVLVDEGMNPNLANLPIKIEKPVYGDLNPSFTNFMAPGVIISIPFFMATGLTALSFVIERKEGLLDRSCVAGVSAFEIMAAHVGVQFLVMTVQVALLLVFALLVFGVPYEGPLILVIIITLFQGLCGMALGLLISAVCDTENAAIQLALGSVYPNLLLSGIIWPIEAMPKALQYISMVLPMTYPAEAMRYILSRGWDMTYMAVWRGFLVTVGWGWALFALSILILKIKGM
ncbi:ABC transporter G family member 20-like isoform X2 [Lineus longissimus]|uniref:ABC transporter G family member 20-like isoform X2 n=1 Tax=Lineus longissimus TaxID=88925 RepID=UPI00315C5DD5